LTRVQKDEEEEVVPYAMPTAPMAKKQLRLQGGAMSFNCDDDARALEKFLGTERVIEMTVYGTVSGAGVSHNTYTVSFLVCDYMIDRDELARALPQDDG
jgi:hypothetical protein